MQVPLSPEEVTETEMNLADWCNNSQVNGPGRRYVLWLQGCPKRCRGCVNRSMQPFVRRHQVSVEKVARALVASETEGVTLTGGEPMCQAPALGRLSEKMQAAGRSVMCYTGYVFEDLIRCRDPWIRRLLDATDILVDGPYLPEIGAPKLWRGSANQRVIFLSNRYRNWSAVANAPQSEIELAVADTGLSMTGVWQRNLLEEIEDALFHHKQNT